jgi:hypothetical protein
VPLLMSIHEVDDALTRANAIPDDERTDMWQGIVDALLDRRAALATVEANLREIAVIRDRETR